jgi:hypothetical protein
MGDSAYATHMLENQTHRSKVKILEESLASCLFSKRKKPTRSGELAFLNEFPKYRSGKKIDRAGLLDCVVDFAVKLGGNSGHAAREDFPGFSGELGEELRIRGDYEICWDIVTAARHFAVRLAEIDAALDCFWLGHGLLKLVLAKFAVKGAALEEVVELHLFEAARRAQALFVTRGDVT